MQNGESGKAEVVIKAGTAKKRPLARMLKIGCLVLALVAGVRVCLLSMHVTWHSQRITTAESKGHRSTLELQYPDSWICSSAASRITGGAMAVINPKPISKFTKWCSQSIPLLRYLDTDDNCGITVFCVSPETTSDPSMQSQRIAQLVRVCRNTLLVTNLRVDTAGKEEGGESDEIVNRIQFEQHDARTHAFVRSLVVYRRRAKRAVKAEPDFVYDHYLLSVHGPEAAVSAMRPTIDEIFRRVRLVEEK